MRIEINGFTTIGQRDSQQDYSFYKVTEKELLAVLCDGMGGMDGGERASRYAVNRFCKDYYERSETEELADFMLRELNDIDEAIFQFRNFDGRRLGAGTTFCATIILENGIYWGSVGDSRIYLFRDNRFCRMTRDHNYQFYVDSQYEKGLLSSEEYTKKSQQGEKLISYLGVGNLELVDISKSPLELQPGDQILMCSDGLYKTLSDQELSQCLLEKTDIKTTIRDIQELIEKKNDPYQDNTTVILIRITE